MDEPLSARIDPGQGAAGAVGTRRRRTARFYEPAIHVIEPVDELALLGRGCSDEEPKVQRTP